MVNSQENSTQVVAARGLATTNVGQEILQQHINNNDLEKHHASLKAFLKEAATPSDKLKTPTSISNDRTKAGMTV